MKKGSKDILKYLGGRQKLSATELAFMRLIWEHPEGISSEAIYSAPCFTQAQKTKCVILYNIGEKGYVKNVQQGRHYIYYPLVSRVEYEQALLKQQLDDSFENASFANMVASFCGKNRLTPSQMKRIDDLLEDIKNDIDTE